MKPSRVLATTIAVAIVTGSIGTLFWRSDRTPDDSATQAPRADSLPSQPGSGATLPDFDDKELAIIEQLKNKYGSQLAGAALQVNVIGNLMDLLQKLYPHDWAPRLLRILASAFPGQVKELRDRFDALQQYNAWLKDVLPHMTFPDPAARREAIWNQRLAMFGPAANDIWAVERREQKLAATIDQLASSNAPLQEKKQTYLRSLKETYGEGITALNAPHQTQNMTRFLSLPSVQDDLRQLPVEARREALRSFRSDMGLDPAALQRWDVLDEERDTSRSIGTTYMAERSKLEARYQGAELEQQVIQLRSRLFSAEEARFIRNEEASGHFRFRTPQTIGVN